MEFETLGGKGKSKSWRCSIYHENTPLFVYLQSLAPLADIRKAASPMQSRTPSPNRLSTCRVFDPALAFIKAYRLKGDNINLKQSVLSTFDPSSIALAHNVLWDTFQLLTLCHSDR